MTQDEELIWQALIAFMVIYFGLIVVVGLVVYVVMAITLSLFFRKVGVEVWIAWVPVYGYWKWLEVGGFNGAIALLMLIPGASIVTAVFLYIAMYRIGFAFRKDTSWVVLGVFLAPVWCYLLSRDTESYTPALQSAAGFPPLAGSGARPAAPPTAA